MEDVRRFRTDLALEAADTGDNELPLGVEVDEIEAGKVKKTTVKIKTEQAALRLGRPVGEYITFEGPLDAPSMEELLTKQLKDMLPEGQILVVGLGNRNITPDVLGPDVAQKIIATRHLPKEYMKQCGIENMRDVCSISPGVMGQTGIETADIVASILKDFKFSAVVAIDALAARSIQRLGNTVQVSDAGISPGSGVKNQRNSLCKETLGVPVFAIGIPTVIDIGTATQGMADENAANMIVTSRDIDELTAKGVKLISTALNLAMQKDIPCEIVKGLM